MTRRKKNKNSPFDDSKFVCEIRKNLDGQIVVFRNGKPIGFFESVTITPTNIIGKVGAKKFFYDHFGNEKMITKSEDGQITIIKE